MKVHILSDLHTEFSNFDPPHADADVVVLAGDIGVGMDAIEWAERQFPEVPVVYVPGNHEFYGCDIRDIGSFLVAAPANFRILNNDSSEIDGVRFLGCTLWTDFKYYGDGEAWFARQQAGEHHRKLPARAVDPRAYTCVLRLRDLRHASCLQSARVSSRILS